MSAPRDGKGGAPGDAITLLQATVRTLDEVARTIVNAPDQADSLSRLLDWVKGERTRFGFGKRPQGLQ